MTTQTLVPNASQPIPASPQIQGLQQPLKATRILTRDKAMLETLEQAGRIAAAQSTVLLLGESGTGKELVARALHQKGSRCHGPFIALNCAALSDSLLETELFGHEKGAFTGADRQRPGRFELADGGSLFLDEIGAADPKVQLRLLRVLQEQSFERVGGSQTLQVNLRIIAATNEDLGQAVKQGTFRQDLFYRLDILTLRLPPLRQRRDDIPLLLEHFIRLSAQRNRCPLRTLSPEALAWLQEYPWPGNIRQLENTVERMVVLARGKHLDLKDIPAEILHWREDPEIAATAALPFREARLDFDRRYLQAALKQYKGVISQVAEGIGMSRKNLYIKLESLDIDYERYRRVS